MSRQKNLLSDFLKRKRVSAGLSQRDVADKLGYETPQFISNWERGVSYPPVKELGKIAAMYKTSAQELFDLLLNNTIQEVTEDLRRKFATSVAWKQTSFAGVRRGREQHQSAH